MRLLIMGGSGFVSATLAREAVGAGWDVSVVTRGQRPVPEGVTSIQADRNNHAALAGAINRCGLDWDLVVDCIGMTPVHAEQDVKLWSGRTGRFIFVSTDFVYDPRDRKVPQSEYDARFARDGYGGGKRQAEEVLLKTDHARLPWIILRPSHIYGAGSWLGCLPLHSRDPELLKRLQKGEPLSLLSGGSILQHPVFAADLARTILSSCNAPGAVGGIFNVSGPEVVESRRYYEIIAEALGVALLVKSVDVENYLRENPGQGSYCCDRVYDITALAHSGLDIPSTRLRDGMQHVIQAALKAPVATDRA